MSREHFEKVKESFLKIRSSEESVRAELLSELEQADPESHAEVLRLLRADEADEGFLKTPAFGNGFSVEPSTLSQQAAPGSLGLLGPYRLLDVIAEGGMGLVYRALQERPRRVVALKVLRPDTQTESMKKRLEREAELLGQLQHPGIAQVYEAGFADTIFGRQPYYVMEFVEGLALVEHVRQHNTSRAGRWDLLAQIADAVDHAHQKSVIHRDLKPSNILVTPQGRAKVVDFGVARLEESDAEATRATACGDLIGTLPYMSPEQRESPSHELDGRTDVYALGVIAYELLCGQRPFDVRGLSLPAALRTLQRATPRPLREHEPSLGGDAERVVSKAMARDRDQRYRSAAAFASDCRRLVEGEPLDGSFVDPATPRRFSLRALGSVIAFGFAIVVMAFVSDRTGASDPPVTPTQAPPDPSGLGKSLILAMEHLDPSSPQALSPTTLLDNIADNVGESLASSPEMEIVLRNKLARNYAELGHYDRGYEEGVRALELARQHRGEGHPDTLRCLALVGTLQVSRGEDADARQILERAIEQSGELPCEIHSVAAHPRLSLIDILKRQGLNELALMQLEELRERWSEVVGDQDMTSWKIDRALGDLISDDAEALRLLRGAYERSEGELGDDHPLTLSIGLSYSRRIRTSGDVAEARAHVQRLIALSRAKLGPEHPVTQAYIHELASCELDQGKFLAAQSSLTSLLATRERLNGTYHRSTLVTRTNLGWALLGGGKLLEAQRVLEECLEQAPSILSENTETFGRLLGLYGECLRRRESYDGAVEKLGRSVDILEKVLGPDHPECLVKRMSLGQASVSAGALVEGLAHLEHAYQRSQETLGDADVRTLRCLHNLASALEPQGEDDRVERLYRGAYEGRSAVLGLGHPHTLNTLNNLARFYSQRSRDQEALVLFEALVSRGRQALEDRNPRLALFLENFGLCLRRIGQERRALEYLVPSFEILADSLGLEHRRTQAALVECIEAARALNDEDEASMLESFLVSPTRPSAR